jgi:YegS/Rv2252/BmrU family lipid kinase
MIRVAFIINGSKKLKVQVHNILIQCEEQSELETIQFHTKKPKEAIEIAKSCAIQNFDVVVSVGGDGTMNEVLNGLMSSQIKTLPVLAVLPNGTGNDFIKSAKLKANISDFINAILENRITKIDIGRVEGNGQTNYFLNISDIGFGGKVIEILDNQRKYIGGKMSYSIAILRAFIGFRKPTLSIITDDFQFQGEVLMAAICNGGVFGNGLTINPYAKIEDGVLNITLLGKVSLFDYIKNLRKLKKGIPISHPEAHYLETKSVGIKLIKGKASSEMDGEFLEIGDQIISVVENGIRILRF